MQHLPHAAQVHKQLNHDLTVARGLWDFGFWKIPDIYIYIDRRVRLKSAQLNHDLIVARGLWDSGSLGIPDIYTHTYTYTYIYIYIYTYIYIEIVGYG